MAIPPPSAVVAPSTIAVPYPETPKAGAGGKGGAGGWGAGNGGDGGNGSVIEIQPQVPPDALAPPVPVKPAQPAISGRVLAVHPDLKILMLSVGSQQGVTPGCRFTIKRDGHDVAKAQVEKVYPDMSTARYAGADGNDVNVNDDAVAALLEVKSEAPPKAIPAPPAPRPKSGKDDF